MYLWRLHPQRSARWQASRRLRAERTTRGWAWGLVQAKSLSRRATWKVATVSAFVVSAPIGFYVGSAPAHWLDGAWPVSAILVGFDLSLIIFLLQLAASQNVRSEATFRALLISSRVVWPVTFSLVFIAWTAGIEFSAGVGAASPSSFANAWVLAYFLAQIALFGLVFVRAFELVSPTGVGRVMQRAQADLVRRSVESRLRHKYANAVFAAAEKRANLAVGLTLSGQRVLLNARARSGIWTRACPWESPNTDWRRKPS